MPLSDPPPAARTTNTHHLFDPPPTRAAWETRARALREQIRFSAGLWPSPPRKTPLRPIVTQRLEGPDFVVENVALRTRPGFYLGGNLFRPKGLRGPLPAVLVAHGHWERGRLHREADVPPAAPPPAPPAEGRADLVALGVTLARQGFIAFAYDMVGYNDTDQVSHRFAGGLDAWLWGVSLMGLQLWNSVRALDYLESLPDVDKGRIGATGASGGGTQVFLLTAIDERVRAAVPVNMVSASMQGGCLCENGPGLRVGTDNVEIAALAAPRPLLLVSATGDWTREVPREEGPAVRRVYDLYGAGDRTGVVQFNYNHNYNRESREAMYAWFARWLQNKQGADVLVRERPVDLDPARLRVWSAAHPRPADALGEAQLLQALRDEAQKQARALEAMAARDPDRFRKTAVPVLSHALAVRAPDFRTGNTNARPAPDAPVLVVTTSADSRAAETLADALRRQGRAVTRLRLDPIEADPARLAADFFTTYNRTPLGDRVQQIVDVLAEGRRERRGAAVDLAGLGEAGLWTLLARALVSGPGRAVIDAARFDPARDDAFVAHLYAPGLRRAGDVRTAVLLAAPGPLCLVNAGPPFDGAALAAEYRRAGGASCRVEAGPLPPSEIAAWLLAR